MGCARSSRADQALYTKPAAPKPATDQAARAAHARPAGKRRARRHGQGRAAIGATAAARPAPPRSIATLGSSALPRISSSAFGSATTTTLRPTASPAAACRPHLARFRHAGARGAGEAGGCRTFGQGAAVRRTDGCGALAASRFALAQGTRGGSIRPFGGARRSSGRRYRHLGDPGQDDPAVRRRRRGRTPDEARSRALHRRGRSRVLGNGRRRYPPLPKSMTRTCRQ